MPVSSGTTIYRLRTQRSLSQSNLADQLGVSRQPISKWEADSTVPELNKLSKLNELFGVTLDEPVKGEPAKIVSQSETVSPPQTVAFTLRADIPGRKVAGAILLCVAFFIAFFWA